MTYIVKIVYEQPTENPQVLWDEAELYRSIGSISEQYKEDIKNIFHNKALFDWLKQYKITKYSYDFDLKHIVFSFEYKEDARYFKNKWVQFILYTYLKLGLFETLQFIDSELFIEEDFSLGCIFVRDRILGNLYYYHELHFNKN